MDRRRRVLPAGAAPWPCCRWCPEPLPGPCSRAGRPRTLGARVLSPCGEHAWLRPQSDPPAILRQGPPANEDTREKAAQGIKAFTELLVTKCTSPAPGVCPDCWPGHLRACPSPLSGVTGLVREGQTGPPLARSVLPHLVPALGCVLGASPGWPPARSLPCHGLDRVGWGVVTDRV